MHPFGLCFQTPSTTPSATPTTPATPSSKPTSAQWCMPKTGVSDAQLQANLDYACGHGIDCSAIQPGGACFEPNTVASHAAYAMNLYYQTVGKSPWNCDFSHTATFTSSNPSKFFGFPLFFLLREITSNNTSNIHNNKDRTHTLN